MKHVLETSALLNFNWETLIMEVFRQFLSIWRLLHSVKLTVKILSISVAFLENMNSTPSIFIIVNEFSNIFQQQMI